MCGILGVYRLEINHKYDDILQKGMKKLIVESQQRGKDASGFAYVSPENQLKVCKTNVPAKSFVRTKQFREFLRGGALNAKAIIGHTRAETKGDNKFNVNNHPIYSNKSGLAVVHNGMISNYDKIQTIEKFTLDGECDSEIILRLIESKGIEETVGILYGSFTFAVLNAKKPEELVLYKGTNPLYLAYFPQYKWIVFASDEGFIKRAFNVVKVNKKILGFFEYEDTVIEHYTTSVSMDTQIKLFNKDIKTVKIKSSTNDTYSHFSRAGSYIYGKQYKYNNGYSNGRYKGDNYGYNRVKGNWNEGYVPSYGTQSKLNKVVPSSFGGKNIPNKANVFGESNLTIETCDVPTSICGLDSRCNDCPDQAGCLILHCELTSEQLLDKLVPECCPHKDTIDGVPIDEAGNQCKHIHECGFMTKCKGCNKGKRKTCKRSTKYRRRKANKLKNRIERIIQEASEFADQLPREGKEDRYETAIKNIDREGSITDYEAYPSPDNLYEYY